MNDARGSAGAAPAARRPGIDVARVLALALVVVGHLTLAVIDRGPDGELRGSNILALRPGWAWAAMLSPMPVFFAAAGWANLTSDLRSAAPRLHTLVGLGAVVVCSWVSLAGIAALVTGESGVVTDGARLATHPLWFLAAYVPLAAAAPRLRRLAARPAVTFAVALAVLALIDAARFEADAPRWVGWPGFFVAWSVPWLLGIWWRDRSEAGPWPERRVGLALFLGGAVASALLVRFGGYSPALIDAVPGRRSNTTPPTLFTAVAAVTQVGGFMVVIPLLDAAGRRWSRLWARAGEAAVGVYVFHLTALALCSAVIALGLPVPTRLTATWWLTRPLWWAAVLGVTGAFVAATAAVQLRAARAAAGRSAGKRVGVTRLGADAVLRLGVLAVTIGAAAVGLKGPRSVPMATVCVLGFVLGWWFLRGGTDPGRVETDPEPDVEPASP